MRLKKVISVLLGIFVVISVGALIYKNSIVSKKVDASPVSKKDKRVDSIYFHGKVRCHTCTLMENYIKETINDNFSEQLKSGQLNFQTINVEEAVNRHYVKDYKLYTKSFVISLKDQGKEQKWLNCDKIWSLVRDKDTFKKYIKTEVERFLGML